MNTIKKTAYTLALAMMIISPISAWAATDSSPSSNIWLTTSNAIDPHHLPLGDKKYSTEPKVGYVFACDPDHYFNIPLGSNKTGAWVSTTTSTWDVTKKLVVEGNHVWPNAEFSITTSGTERIFRGNGLPVGSPTGAFPVAKSDTAYSYDHNPNSVIPYDVSYSVPLNPTIADKPSCIQFDPVGIALNGVRISTGIDSQGRDELAYEVQDLCSGVPQPNKPYHYHALSDCMAHIRENNALVGYAADGFGIFSPYDASGKELSTKDLDECHGTTSQILWDGKSVTMYHYVLTRDYPYTISCFRGTPHRFPLGAPPFIPNNPASIWHYIVYKIEHLFGIRDNRL